MTWQCSDDTCLLVDSDEILSDIINNNEMKPMTGKHKDEVCKSQGEGQKDEEIPHLKKSSIHFWSELRVNTHIMREYLRGTLMERESASITQWSTFATHHHESKSLIESKD